MTLIQYYVSFMILAIVDSSHFNDCYDTAPWMYTGTVNVTISGRACQRWDQQTPHEHGYTSMRYFPMENTLSEVQNYCRATEGDGVFWCYTVDPLVVWDTCSVTKCLNTTINNVSTPQSSPEPSGPKTTWEIPVPEPEDFELTRYDKDRSRWKCFRTDIGIACPYGTKNMCEYNGEVFDPGMGVICTMPLCCALDCISEPTYLYNGTWDFTERGFPCIMWTSTYRHTYCRDPTKQGYLWCYSASLDKRWEPCGVIQCKPESTGVHHRPLLVTIILALAITFLNC